MKTEHDRKRKVFLRMVISVCIVVFVFAHPLSVSADVILSLTMISTGDIVTSAHILTDRV